MSTPARRAVHERPASAPSSSSPWTSSAWYGPSSESPTARASATSLFGSSGKRRELCQARPARHRREGEQVDTELGELRQDAISRPQLVADVRVVVLDAADREGHCVLLAHPKPASPGRHPLTERRAAGVPTWATTRIAARSSSRALHPPAPPRGGARARSPI